jgi:hypothetical protein
MVSGGFRAQNREGSLSWLAFILAGIDLTLCENWAFSEMTLGSR